MTDLDTLRRALRASPEPEPAFDPAAIITRGRRLRWRRRAAAAGGGICLAAAVFGAVAGIGRLTAPSPGPAHHPIAPVGPAGATTRPRPVPSPVRRGAAPTPSVTASPTAIPAAPETPGATPTPTTPAGAQPSPSTSAAGPTKGPTARATTASTNQPSATPTATQ